MPAFLILLFRFLRRPFMAGAALSVFYPLLYLISNLFLIGGDLAVRLDYGLSRAGWFYARVEGWNALDALYFSVITLTTVGYGDFSPHTPAGKIFTMIYVLVGLGLISGFVFLLAERSGILKRNGPETEKTS